MITIEVQGTPAPKGSARAFVVKGRAVLAPGGSKVNRKAIKAWEATVAEAGRAAMVGPLYRDMALSVEITFRLARPAGHIGKHGVKASAPRYPAVLPDLDKCVRSTLDPLTGVVFDDDSRIVQVVARKLYADHQPPGATILIGVAA